MSSGIGTMSVDALLSPASPRNVTNRLQERLKGAIARQICVHRQATAPPSLT